MTHQNQRRQTSLILEHSKPRSRMVEGETRVVALGGGHGLAANLRALRHVAHDITAVVTVADNGGSSGRIRKELPILPPGDLRMALSALCEDSDWGIVWRDVVQHRFESDGELNGHALGNLLIAALWQMFGDPIQALDHVGALLGVRGRVLPMALEPLDIEATVTDRTGTSRMVRGQAEVASLEGHVDELRLIPSAPEVPTEVLEAIAQADWIILGPGSWFSSVLPHLLIPEIVEAIRSSKAKRLITMNLTSDPTETEGMTSTDHLQVLMDTAPDLGIDAIVADPTMLDDSLELVEFAQQHGISSILRQVSVGRGIPVHDPVRLAAAYRDVFGGVIADVRED
ncbi:gluconeogenesis factor YvcK family protein [Helcobacillus massiliensis]|uniref:gluconeogenesis factor YvcK family protein n=1 Tax=Helcobacillus massiliensis TaxID=521392 RepID=UPI004055E397